MAADYGSDYHLLRWMGRHRNAFDAAVQAVIGPLFSPIQWLDMEFCLSLDSSDRELEGLEFIENAGLQEEWKAWWPQTGKSQNWDAVGWIEIPHDRRIVLAEAKAHAGECRSNCRANERGGLARIQQSFQETAVELGVSDISPWLRGNYQLANRLAVLHFLRQRQYSPHLLQIYFVGDLQSSTRNSPQTPDEWAAPLAAQKRQMGLSERHSLSPYIHELFLHVSQPTAWSRPDASAIIDLPMSPRF